jgi:hypothetical protein
MMILETVDLAEMLKKRKMNHMMASCPLLLSLSLHLPGK